MKKRIHRFLRALLWLMTGGPKAKSALGTEGRRPETEGKLRSGVKAGHHPYSGSTLSRQQCLELIDSIGRIMKEEAAKKGMLVHIHVVPAPEKPPSTDMVHRENGSP